MMYSFFFYYFSGNDIMDQETCFDISGKKLCLSYYSMIKLGGLFATLFALTSSKSDLKFFVIMFVVFLIGEILFYSFSKGFDGLRDIPVVISNQEPIRSKAPDDRIGVGNGRERDSNEEPNHYLQKVDISGGPMNIPERFPQGESAGLNIMRGKRLSRLRPIDNQNALTAYEQNLDYTAIKHKMTDPENDYYRDQYSRNRTMNALKESNFTTDGYRYGAPQETRTIKKIPEHTYLDAMGIYPGGINNGSFTKSWVMN